MQFINEYAIAYSLQKHCVPPVAAIFVDAAAGVPDQRRQQLPPQLQGHPQHSTVISVK